jgi:plasmid stabilization system protein ParE
MRIEYHPALEGDIRAIRYYYNDRYPQLGDEFVNEFEKQVLRIASMPTRCMIVKGDIRRSLMRRFPYLILFKVMQVRMFNAFSW